MQSLKGGSKERFYNPILQNSSHINAVRDYLGIDDDCFFSFTVFSERCELKKVSSDPQTYAILRRHHLVETVNRVIRERKRVFTDGELDELEGKLAQLGKTEEKTQTHIKMVEAIQDSKICPCCLPVISSLMRLRYLAGRHLLRNVCTPRESKER